MDSDAVVDRVYEHIPINALLGLIQKKLQWNYQERPMIFNQDGPCWWCGLVKSLGYKKCLNAGTVLWYRDPEGYSEGVLESWWESSMDSYEGNPIRRYHYHRRNIPH